MRKVYEMTKSKYAPAVRVLADQSKAVSLINPVYCRTQIKELRSCVRVEVAVLVFPS